jgi:hypothetical protein
MVGLAAVAIMSAIALADRKTDTVTFANDVTVGGATVKAGTYTVRFDYKTNELSVINGNRSCRTGAAQSSNDRSRDEL